MAAFQINELVNALHEVRREWREFQHRQQEGGERELPSREVIACVVKQLTGALFPMRLGPTDLRQESEDFYVGHTLDAALHDAAGAGCAGAAPRAPPHRRRAGRTGARGAVQRVRAVRAALPAIRRLLDSDVLAAYHGDPAARSVDEVLLCYPGVLAMIHHRLAHELYQLGLPLLARIVAELAHGQTGIDIHPGAHHRRGLLHRPRHRRRDRRDGRDRRARAAVPGRDAGRQALPDRRRRQPAKGPAAPPDRGGRRGDLRRRHHPRAASPSARAPPSAATSGSPHDVPAGASVTQASLNAKT